jgi:hypothetical protein
MTYAVDALQPPLPANVSIIKNLKIAEKKGVEFQKGRSE